MTILFNPASPPATAKTWAAQITLFEPSPGTIPKGEIILETPVENGISPEDAKIIPRQLIRAANAIHFTLKEWQHYSAASKKPGDPPIPITPRHKIIVAFEIMHPSAHGLTRNVLTPVKEALAEAGYAPDASKWLEMRAATSQSR